MDMCSPSDLPSSLPTPTALYSSQFSVMNRTWKSYAS